MKTGYVLSAAVFAVWLLLTAVTVYLLNINLLNEVWTIIMPVFLLVCGVAFASGKAKLIEKVEGYKESDFAKYDRERYFALIAIVLAGAGYLFVPLNWYAFVAPTGDGSFYIWLVIIIVWFVGGIAASTTKYFKAKTA